MKYIGMSNYEKEVQVEIFDRLRNDELGMIIKNSPLLRDLASTFFRKCKGSVFKTQEVSDSIRGKLRLLAKLYIEFKKNR